MKGFEELGREKKALKHSELLRELNTLDCLVCSYLAITGDKHGILIHCKHPNLCVPIRIKKQFTGTPGWCPKKRMIRAAIERL